MATDGLLNAMKVGEVVKDPVAVKNQQKTANMIYVGLNAVVAIARIFYPQLEVYDEALLVLAGGGAVLVGIVNNIYTAITSRKTGGIL